MFHGLSAFPITPSGADGVVRTNDLSGLVARLAAAAVGSIGVLGSTGTYAYLTRDQRRRAIAAANDAKGQTPLIASASALRTDDAIALARDAQGAGADGLLLAAMSYTPLTEEEVFSHYTAVADATDLPLCIYDNPGTTHFSFSRDLIVRLSEHPRIMACKLPAAASGDFAGDIAWLRSRAADGFSIGYSADWVLSSAMSAGADAFYSVVGGILPDATLALINEARSNGPDADTDFAPLWDLFKAHGSLRVVYAIAHMMGLTDAQPPRPILPLDNATRDRIAQAIQGLQTGQP